MNITNNRLVLGDNSTCIFDYNSRNQNPDITPTGDQYPECQDQNDPKCNDLEPAGSEPDIVYPEITFTNRKKCVPTLEFMNTAMAESWCENNCNRGYCPPSHCKCIVAAAVGEKPRLCYALSNLPGANGWCRNNCARNYCPTNKCKCDPAKKITCTTSTAFGQTEENVNWCVKNCVQGFCPRDKCKCVAEIGSGNNITFERL